MNTFFYNRFRSQGAEEKNGGRTDGQRHRRWEIDTDGRIQMFQKGAKIVASLERYTE